MFKPNAVSEKVLYPELSYALNQILFAIHNNLGRFRNEKQYGDALENQLVTAGIGYVREFDLNQSFDGERLGRNTVDFIIDNSIILEIKAKQTLLKQDYYQIKRYLISSGLSLGILVNFRAPYLTPRRILNLEVE